MPIQLNIKLTLQDGITRNIAGKYCDKNILIVPLTDEEQIIKENNIL